MKSLVRLAAVFCALAASAAANANSFTFTYTTTSYYSKSPFFYDGAINVTGSFEGDATGNLITNLSNISVSVNDVALIGSGNLFSSMTSYTGLTIMAGVVSRDGTASNFNFTDGADNYFQMQSTTTFPGDSIAYTAALNQFAAVNAVYANDTDSGIAGRWTLTEVAAVPEPETYAMLLAGLGLVGFAARRRRAAGTAALAA